MYNVPKNNGIGVHWGVSSTGITGYGSLAINGTTQGLEADTATATDGDGFVVADVTYNHRETATLETWVSGSADAVNATVAQANLPQTGDQLTITDSVYTLFAGSNWIVGSVGVTRAATDLAKASISLRRYAKIS